MFGGRTFSEVGKVKRGHEVGALFDCDDVLTRKGRDTRELFLSTSAQRKGWPPEDTVRRWPATCKPRREVSPETNPDNSLILDFQPPQL